jgi:hypothetical protein
VSSATAEVSHALVRLAARVPALLSEEDWRALLARPERVVRAAAAASAHPSLAPVLVEVAGGDPSWTVRRAALQRLASLEGDSALLDRAIVSAVADDSAFVRGEALSLAELLTDERACELAASLASDRDPWVAERARSVTSRRCVR